MTFILYATVLCILSLHSSFLYVAGLPGIVVPTVESFSVDSVRVTWDPPAEPNEDIELLKYIVYVLVRDLGTQDNIDPDSLGTRDQDFVRPWDRREALLSSGLDENKQVVAIVVAESAQGLGAVGEEAFGNTFGRSECQGVYPYDVIVTYLFVCLYMPTYVRTCT